MNFVGIVFQALPLLKSGLRFSRPLLYKLGPYEIRVGELAKGVNNLRKVRNRVRCKVKKEENQNVRPIPGKVREWIEDANKILSDYKKFRVDIDGPCAVWWSNGYIAKHGIRRRLTGEINTIIEKVNGLLEKAKDDEFFYWFDTSSSDADFDEFWYEWFGSRIQTMDAIITALEDSNVEMVGVFGQKGVGKTALIKEVAMEVKRDMFDVVIMVNVTSHPDIQSIQGTIADMLGMNLEEESENGRAARIWERLENPKEKILIILDDMRVKLNFNKFGIPFKNNYAMKTEEFDASSLVEDSPASHKGCKILMISDDKQVLLSQMDGKGIPTFRVEALTENEAETMFKTMAEIIGDKNSMFEKLATQIAKKCEGLPIMIVTAANALKNNKNIAAWECFNQRFDGTNLTSMPELGRYLFGENDELRQTFLVCASMGQDALITDLVRYCIGLGFLQLHRIDTVREARDKVHSLIGKLKELSLLSDSFSTDRFTMHDIIRDAAESIASDKMYAFAVKNKKLDDWPDMKSFQSYTTISLHHCRITDIMMKFPESMSFLKLKVFHLDNKDSRLKIPDNFFVGMEELRVLVLIGINLSPLPSSIECLKKLRMLCLEQCKLGEHLSIIGELENLRVLCLSGSRIDSLPGKLKKLAKLQILDISNCFKLEVIPANVMSSLASLEELYVGNSPIKWNDEGLQGNKNGKNASLSELGQLNHLTTLDIQIKKITHLAENTLFDKLDSYKIIIRDFNACPVWDSKMLETLEASRYLELQLDEGFNIYYQKEIRRLLRRVEILLLGQINDVKDIFPNLNFEGFTHLKHLSIVNNSKVMSIINSRNTNNEKAFPKLESLFLYNVEKMEHICCTPLKDDSFNKLRILKLNMCGKLKGVFSSSMIKHFSALETIEISECYSLKEIVYLGLEMQSINGDQKIDFPKLRSLKLQSLYHFIRFYQHGTSIEEAELFHEKVEISKLERLELSSIKIKKIWSDQPLTRPHFKNLMHLGVNACWNMEYLLSLSMSKILINLQSLSLSECEMMKSIFIKKETNMIETEDIIFPNLKIINLKSMKKLKEIWPGKFSLHSFGKLNALIIEGCNELQNIFPSYTVGKFQSLCNLKVTNCKSIKEIFDLKHCGKRDAKDMANLQNVHVDS